jgi:hypothetical protein
LRLACAANCPARYGAGLLFAVLGCPRAAGVAVAVQPVTPVLDLMVSDIAPAAEVYWESVQVTVDETGEHEQYPETDEEWESVWAAGVSIAESGNLLMMTPRAVDDGAWMQFSRSLIEAGVEAAAAAKAHDVERVFAAGEQVYNVCTACHARYVSDLQRVSGEN